MPYSITNSTTIVAVTLPHAAGVVDITLFPYFVGPPTVLPGAFTFVGAEVPTLSTAGIAVLAALLGLLGAMNLKRG